MLSKYEKPIIVVIAIFQENDMLKSERHQAILTLLDEHTYLSMIELADKLHVSDMTIRRDITELNTQKKLIKLYGGAQRIDTQTPELSTNEKNQTNIAQKKHIGKLMNRLIPDQATIYLGAGTTILYALSEIRKKDLVIVTSSLLVLNYVKTHTNYRVLLTGGEFYEKTEEFLGEVAIRAFDNLNIDIAFASTNGIVNNNVTTARFDEGAVQYTAFSKAKTTCIVADTSKLGTSDIYTFTDLSDHDYLLTDETLTDEQRKHYEQYVRVLSE